MAPRRRPSAATPSSCSLRRVAAPHHGAVVVAASAVAAGLSVVLASMAFAVEYAIGGTGAVARRGARRHGRRPRPDRHRRGRHHRLTVERRARRPARPGPRRRRPRCPIARPVRPGRWQPIVKTNTKLVPRRRAARVALALAFFVSPFASSDARRPREGGRSTRASPRPSRTTTWPTAHSPTTGSTASTTSGSAPAWPASSACSSPSASASALFALVRTLRRGAGAAEADAAAGARPADRWAPVHAGTRLARPRRLARSTGCRPQCKVAATVLFVFAVVATPREAFWAYGALRSPCSSAGRARPGPARRWSPAGSSSRLPFVAFALLLPVRGARAARVDVLASRCPRRPVGRPGTSWPRARSACRRRVLAGRPPTPVAELLRGLERLRVPRGLHRDRRLHGALPRRDRRARCAACRSPACPGATTPAGSGRPGRWRASAGAAVHPLLRAGRAGAPGHAVAGATTAPMPDAAGRPPRRRGDWAAAARPCRPGRRRRWRVAGVARLTSTPAPSRSAAWPSPIPTAHQALCGVDLPSQPGERVALLGPNGAGKTTLVLHLNGIHTARHGRGAWSAACRWRRRRCKEIRRRVGIVFQDPDDQLFMPTVRDDVAFGPANLGLRGDELDGAGRRGARPRWAWRTSPTGRPTTSASASAGGWRWPPCWPWSPTSSCSTSRRRTSTRPAAGSWPTSSLGLDLTMLMVTHDLPYALELCPRAVVMNDGVIVADGPTPDILGRRGADGGQPAGAAVRLRPTAWWSGRGSPPAVTEIGPVPSRRLGIVLAGSCWPPAGATTEPPATTTGADHHADHRRRTARRPRRPGDIRPTEDLDLIPRLVRELQPSVVAVLTDEGEGSGVVYAEDGTVVTNNHVVEGADEVRVAFVDGERVDAEVEATDPRSDLAVLQVDRDDLPAARFAEELPAVGELAVAMGNPLGLRELGDRRDHLGPPPRHPRLGRAQPRPRRPRADRRRPSRPGNSGGALVDAAAEVVGINVAYIPPGRRAPCRSASPSLRPRWWTSWTSCSPGEVRLPVPRDHAAGRHAGDRRAPRPRRRTKGDRPVRRGGRTGRRRRHRGGRRDRGPRRQAVRTVEDFLVELRDHEPGEEVDVDVSCGTATAVSFDVRLASGRMSRAGLPEWQAPAPPSAAMGSRPLSEAALLPRRRRPGGPRATSRLTRKAFGRLRRPPPSIGVDRSCWRSGSSGPSR